MQHAQHKENDFLAAGCVRIGKEKKKIEDERKEGRKRKKGGKRQPTLREKQREKFHKKKKKKPEASITSIQQFPLSQENDKPPKV